MPFSGSVNTVIADSVIAVPTAAPQPDADSIGAPTVDTSRVPKGGRIIVTANSSTGTAAARRA